MSYHNYRERKTEGLASLIKRTSTQTVVNDGQVEEKEQVSFQLHSKRFNERDGSESPHPEIDEVDVEALGKERLRLQEFIKDIDAVLIDVEAQS